MRLFAIMFLQLGVVMLFLALLARVVPMPNQADVVGDDLAIIASSGLVVLTYAYLRVRREDR
jgi:hypothetical protein